MHCEAFSVPAISRSWPTPWRSPPPFVAGLGQKQRAARLIGAAQAIRQRLGAPITPMAAGLLEQFLAPGRASIAPGAWDAELAAGRALTQQQAITLLLSLKSAPGTLR